MCICILHHLADENAAVYHCGQVRQTNILIPSKIPSYIYFFEKVGGPPSSPPARALVIDVTVKRDLIAVSLVQCVV